MSDLLQQSLPTSVGLEGASLLDKRESRGEAAQGLGGRCQPSVPEGSKQAGEPSPGAQAAGEAASPLGFCVEA